VLALGMDMDAFPPVNVLVCFNDVQIIARAKLFVNRRFTDQKPLQFANIVQKRINFFKKAQKCVAYNG
jgi:hypothetical protein